MAAMRMANLKSMAADAPSTALSALGVQGFDLIFLDVGLPEMTGFELCSKIRMLPLHEKTPIVFITGDGDVSEPGAVELERGGMISWASRSIFRSWG